MSEYVNLSSSTTDILAAATGLISRGAGLEDTMSGTIAHIKSLENDATWGRDDESRKSFLEGYHKPMETAPGSTDAAPVAADFFKDMAVGKKSLGNTLQEIGNNVVNAMIHYSDSDTGSQTDINSTI